MNTKNFYIVGEKFVEFTKHQNVMTVLGLEKFINNLYSASERTNSLFVIGQGVRRDMFDNLKITIKEKNLEQFIQFKNEKLLCQREDKRIVHKHKVENVMITKPVPCGDVNNDYKSSLILDDRCAELSDHVTGQHLQGMVLTEAARQMMTAVGERYLLEKDEKCNSYFSLNKLLPEFKSFAFPLEMDIYYYEKQIDRVPKRCLKSTALISFVQGGKVVCEVEICFSIFNKDFMSHIEQKAASELVANVH